MSRNPDQGRKPRRSDGPVDPATALHRYAIKLFNQGDGRAVDWPMVEVALFTAGFGCLNEATGSDRAMKVLCQIEGSAYNRLADNPDDATPSTSELPPHPLASPPLASPTPAPGRSPQV